MAVLSTFCFVKGMWFAVVSTPLLWWIFGVGSCVSELHLSACFSSPHVRQSTP